MAILGGGAVSYERGTPVAPVKTAPQDHSGERFGDAFQGSGVADQPPAFEWPCAEGKFRIWVLVEWRGVQALGPRGAKQREQHRVWVSPLPSNGPAPRGGCLV